MFVSESTNFSRVSFDHENHDFWYNKIIGLLIILSLQDQKQKTFGIGIEVGASVK